MVKNKDKWSALSLQERADLINIYAKGGIISLKEIRDHYNSFALGGDTEEEPFVEELSPSVVTDYSVLKQEAKDARDWVLDYYKSEGYKNRAREAGLTARFPLERHLGIFPKKKLRFEEDWSVDSSYNWLYPVIGLQESENPFTNNHADEVGFTTAHEFAHDSKLFNTPAKSYEDTYRSPYYNNSYKKLPKEYIGALEVRQLVDPHDMEFSESYSDLIGLRYLLDKYNIFDSKDSNSVFDSEMYNNLIQDERFKNNRFLKLHEEKQVIDAINNVAQNTTNSNRLDYVNPENIVAFGGKINRFDEGGSIYAESTRTQIPEILRTIEAQEFFNTAGKILQPLASKIKQGAENVGDFINDSITSSKIYKKLKEESKFHTKSEYGHISPVIDDYLALEDPQVKTALNANITGTTYFEDAINNYLIDQEIKDLSRAREYDKRLNVKFETPKDDPERLYIHKVNDIAKNKTREEIIDNLKSKSEKDIEKIQKSLAKEGYYDVYITKGKSKEAGYVQDRLILEGYLSPEERDSNLGRQSITALQQMLVDKGYLPEYTESGDTNIDGALGKKTRDAYNKYSRDFNIDGILGDRTINAYLKQQDLRSKGFNAEVSAEGMVDQCAAWVGKKYDAVTGRGAQSGVYGNAWNMLTNIQNAGGKMLFNLYDNEIFDNVTTPSQLKEATKQAFTTQSLDYSKLLEGDVVGIYIPSSTHHRDVLKEGTTYNTHVGIVVDIENGIPVIEHNILGKVRREPIDHLTGSTSGKPVVTAASRPKKGEFIQQLTFKDAKSKYELPEGAENPLMREYMDSLAASKETFADIFSDVDMDFIEKAAIAITKRETNFMNTKQSDVLEGSVGWKEKQFAKARKLAHDISGTPEDAKSQDLTKMKFRSLSPVYRESIGLDDPSQLSTDPTITGRAVMLLLSKNYDYFKRLAEQNPSLGLTKEDIENATILSYNRGLGSTHTMGFNSDGSFNYDELMYLRYSGREDAKEKDINSTNFKYLYKLGPAGELLANYLYSKKEAHQPYVSSAREVMAQLKKTKK